MSTKSNNETVIKIKSVKLKGKKDKYEVSYYKDDVLETMILLEDQIVKYRILKDKEFLLEEWEQILSKYNTSLWFEKCINHISFKKRTIKEIQDYLKASELEEDNINEVLERLITMRLLDDEDYASSFLDETIRKRKGLKYFISELTKRGVDSNIIKKVSLNYPEDLMIDELVKKIQKEQLKLITYPLLYQKQKLNDKLLRDGFSSQIVTEVFNKIKFSEDIEERLQKEISAIQRKTSDKNKIIQKLLSKGYTFQDIKKYFK